MICGRHFSEAIRLCWDWKFWRFRALTLFQEGATNLDQWGVRADFELRKRTATRNLRNVLKDPIGETRTNLEVEFAEDQSYATGAQCLLKLIDDCRRQVAI